MLSTRPGTPGSSRRVATLTVVGALLTATVTWSGGVIGPPGFARPFTSWGGLLSTIGVWPEHDRWPGLVLAASLVGFTALWVATGRIARAEAWTPRDVWVLGTGWVAPLVLGPPVLSNDVFSYVAQGAVAATGADPTRISSMALGWNSPFVQAVDPLWRETPSPYGPLATLLQRETVSAAGAHPALAVVALRLVALLSVVGIAALAVSLARRADGPAPTGVLLLTWANPLVLLHVVAAIHLEGVLVLLVLLAIRAALVRSTTGDAVALLAATGAAAIKLPVGAVVAAVVVMAVATRVAGRPARIRRGVTASAVVATAYALFCAAARSGWQVLAVVSAPSAGRTPAAPATMLATVLHPLDWMGLVDQTDLDTLGRAVLAVAAVGVIGWLLATVSRRPLPVTAGLALLTLAAGSPVLYPWYLVWSVPLLAAVATGAWRRRLVLLSAAGAVMTVQGLTHLETWVVASSIVTAVVVAVVVTEARDRRLQPVAAWRRTPAWQRAHHPA